VHADPNYGQDELDEEYDTDDSEHPGQWPVARVVGGCRAGRKSGGSTEQIDGRHARGYAGFAWSRGGFVQKVEI